MELNLTENSTQVNRSMLDKLTTLCVLNAQSKTWKHEHSLKLKRYLVSTAGKTKTT